ncbi:myb/SANT-like DNA-binding domain-containing protein 1 [Rhagoletis pomonella]|uniref:myb/SANT-like DNA-binding domain-containing protein 1 n=1 Tax=Rhagoletis pomonella TaxID=28610 RepID=UPI00177C72BF|nr:myb/SANT-like DNA-binding domain-containing protein 1 [Rhagoletis pomonella]
MSDTEYDSDEPSTSAGAARPKLLTSEEYRAMWNLRKLGDRLSTVAECIAFSEENGLLLRSKLCSTHRTPIKKRSQWCKEEVEILLDLWEEKLPQLRGCKRNSHVYAGMAVEMATRGFLFSANEIKVNIHNLTNKYRDERKIVGPSGGTPSAWGHYNKVHQILGGYKSFNLEAIVEESTG